MPSKRSVAFDPLAILTGLTEDELRLRVIGLDDLIAVKTAVGRPQDRATLPYLEAIRRRG
jgi:hypothetical protein